MSRVNGVVEAKTGAINGKSLDATAKCFLLDEKVRKFYASCISCFVDKNTGQEERLKTRKIIINKKPEVV